MKTVWSAIAASLLMLGAERAAAQDDDRDWLTAEEVLSSSEQYFPQVLERLAAQRAASGDVLAATGAFDLVFSADSFTRGGFYNGTVLDGVATQPLRTLGASVFAGYKLSNGTLPIYEDEYFTNSGGTLRAGVLFSLLRDRTIDRQRFAETDARLSLRQAELDLLLTKIGVQQRALVAYWRWVTAGRQLRVYENLARLARDRQQGLDEQVRRGALAQVFLTENLQNLTLRQTLVTTALRDVRMAANDLSLFYRDPNGVPLAPAIEQLPPGASITEVYDLAQVQAVPLSDTLARRPELQVLRTAIERERNRIALAENETKPRLDLNLEVQRGLGGIAEGGPSRDETDTIVGVTFTVPFQRRAALGRLERSRAELQAKQHQQQLREEQIAIELRNLLVDLSTASELLLLAAQDVQQSEIVRSAEVRRFQSGASDFFLLNLREVTAANARVRLLQAELNSRIARANYDAATVNVDRLLIDSSSQP